MPDIPAVPRLWRFPAEPASVPRARRAVAEALPASLTSQLRCDLGLVTSELAPTPSGTAPTRAPTRSSK